LKSMLEKLLNWHQKGKSFIIARANDPFDRNVQFDTNGNTSHSRQPYALTFDPLMYTDLIKVFVAVAIYVKVITRIK
jgi:hypothetical protein